MGLEDLPGKENMINNVTVEFYFTSTASPVIVTTTSSICGGCACTTSLPMVSFLCSVTFFVALRVVVVVVVIFWQHTESGLRLQLTFLILQIKGIRQRDCAGRRDSSRYRERWGLE